MMAGQNIDCGQEHPKMLFRNGSGSAAVDIEGVSCDTVIVHSPEEEGEYLAKGWRTTASEDGEVKKIDPRDAEIARLTAMLAEKSDEGRPRRGRPPKVVDEESHEEV